MKQGEMMVFGAKNSKEEANCVSRGFKVAIDFCLDDGGADEIVVRQAEGNKNPNDVSRGVEMRCS